MTPVLWLAVGILGGAGALLRFGLDRAVSDRLGGEFPWGTLAVNVSGSFFLGLLSGLAPGGRTMLLAGTALIGSYTTFSTWMLESQRLGEDGATGLMLLNLGGSLVAGLAAAVLGRYIGGL